MSEKVINLICNDLNEVDWERYISNDCNDNNNVNSVFKCIHTKICDSVNRHAPLKEHTIKLRKFKSESWITKGIKRSSMVLKNLYKKTLKEGCDDQTRETYILYRNCLNCIKRSCKMQYYQSKCNQYKNNTKKLQELINKSTGKTSNKNCIIDKIRVGNVEHVEPKEIANELCNYYSNIGAKLPNSIPPPETGQSVIFKKNHMKSKQPISYPCYETQDCKNY